MVRPQPSPPRRDAAYGAPHGGIGTTQANHPTDRPQGGRPLYSAATPGGPVAIDTDDVVAAASRGERWALTELFRAYQPGLVRFLRGQDRAAADDLAGEVWMAVAQRLDRFVGDERAFRCWLFTIARNRLADHRRRAVRRRTSPMPPDVIEPHVKSNNGADPADVVAESLGAQDAIELLVRELAPSQAEVLLLRVVAGFDIGEVAAITGRSPGAVRVLQHRALRRLGSTLTSRTVTP